jgi:hypothetical protein
MLGTDMKVLMINCGVAYRVRSRSWSWNDSVRYPRTACSFDYMRVLGSHWEYLSSR